MVPCLFDSAQRPRHPGLMFIAIHRFLPLVARVERVVIYERLTEEELNSFQPDTSARTWNRKLSIVCREQGDITAEEHKGMLLWRIKAR